MIKRTFGRLLASRIFYNARFQQCSTSAKSIEEMEQEFTNLKLQSGIRDFSKQPENVLIVHPKIRWGSNADPRENLGLKLEEACALLQTLPGFSIASTMIIGTDYSVRKKLIWGQGRLDALKEQQVEMQCDSCDDKYRYSIAISADCIK
ncbi:putative GTP-binding protein 6 [Aphelenchoides bicaudatus]|nr:putative GTP-binding protein 6 [Aphelenchoides bicaudatus]